LVNKEFAQQDQAFIAACEKVGIQPTKRQASKWRAHKGLAWKMGR